jgi:1-deoxy-D-xylulose-5-phosphate synthase
VGTGVTPKAQPQLLEIGKAEVIKPGNRVAIFGLGGMCQMAEEAAALLEAQGISTAVINPRWIKPLDGAMIESFGRTVEVICTMEDHVLHNGFGCGVIEYLNDAGLPIPVVRIGWPDQFIEHGGVDVLRQKHGLTAKHAVEKILARLKPKAVAAVLPVEVA